MKIFFQNIPRQRGYTLVELALVAAVIMFAGAFLLRISGSITGRGQFTTTDNQMRIIEAKIRQYYLAHEQLPLAAPAAGTATATIPVDITALDLEQKYRLDGWGNFFQYTTSDTNPATLTGLQDVTDPATGNTFAASYTSNGPDQQLGTNDDLIVYLDLTPEANRLVQNKLRLLMEKVATYEALFAGVNNNGSRETGAHEIDEDPLATATTHDPVLNPGGPDTGCPPISGFFNDPATGLPTLDAIEMAMDGGVGGNAYGCTATDPAGNPVQLAYHLAIYYHLITHSTTNPNLLPGGYNTDPWGNPFRWGYIGSILDDGTPIPDSMDFHFHKFFSSGPNTTTVEDDIVYTGK